MGAKLKPLKLETLKDVDFGQVDRAFNKHLQRAVADCYDRPGDKAARKVTLEFSITPDTGQGTTCDKVFVECEAYSKVPKHRSSPISMKVGVNGSLGFNPDAPENADQATIMGDDDDA